MAINVFFGLLASLLVAAFGPTLLYFAVDASGEIVIYLGAVGSVAAALTGAGAAIAAWRSSKGTEATVNEMRLARLQEVEPCLDITPKTFRIDVLWEPKSNPDFPRTIPYDIAGEQPDALVNLFNHGRGPALRTAVTWTLVAHHTVRDLIGASRLCRDGNVQLIGRQLRISGPGAIRHFLCMDTASTPSQTIGTGFAGWLKIPREIVAALMVRVIALSEPVRHLRMWNFGSK